MLLCHIKKLLLLAFVQASLTVFDHLFQVSGKACEMIHDIVHDVGCHTQVLEHRAVKDQMTCRALR